jgi:hypothetical protein
MKTAPIPRPALIPEFIDILKEIRQRLYECGAGAPSYNPVIDGKAQIYLKSLATRRFSKQDTALWCRRPVSRPEAG